MAGRPKANLELTETQRQELERMAGAGTSEKRMVFRARLILACATGADNVQVAKTLGTSQQTVAFWRGRFLREGMGGLAELARSGRPERIKPSLKGRILSEAVRPPGGLERWSTRSMAKHVGVSKATVQRVWSTNDIKPHRTRIFKLSCDEQFEAKFWDVIGVYLDPPDNAVVLCCDEKSQCQALQRSQPGLPLGQGYFRTVTHDYYRHGTVTLFAALDYLSGKVISQVAPRHRHSEWLKFLKKLDSEITEDLSIHLIVDNYSTHKHQKVRRWLGRHPRFHLHFTPTSASWMNMVERFFRDLSQQAILPGSFGSVAELVDTINLHLAQHNLEPKRYVWHADGQEVLNKIHRAWEAATNPPIIKAI
jgi:transposase